jgi:hypothetical protein
MAPEVLTNDDYNEKADVSVSFATATGVFVTTIVPHANTLTFMFICGLALSLLLFSQLVARYHRVRARDRRASSREVALNARRDQDSH